MKHTPDKATHKTGQRIKGEGRIHDGQYLKEVHDWAVHDEQKDIQDGQIRVSNGLGLVQPLALHSKGARVSRDR
jgi:hypothetical protein